MSPIGYWLVLKFTGAYAAEGYEVTRGRYSGMRVEFAKYKIVEKTDELPEGYQLLVEGSKVAVPVTWLQSVLSKCSNRNPSFILTMLANGLVRPWEVVHGGTSAYTGTYLEPVITALKLYGVMHLNFSMSQATRVLNVKLCTGRRTQKRQFERSLEQRDADMRLKILDSAPTQKP
ncbi:hypothetical protein BaRGS_00027507 [Batillaria attramentaria]|uniref:Uncharacterized protein n=1 Tax=Batillaria attramentaria TaxID=370345 RepID=A0ABD0K3A4_9CAEN